MGGLSCSICGTPWKLDKPLLYHHDKLHCDSHACSRTCAECKDDFEAVSAIEGVSTNVEKPRQSEKATGEFKKAPGYEAMMARLKGGESK